MTRSDESVSGGAFQGSETSSAQVYVYSHGNDPIMRDKPSGLIEFSGRGRDGQQHSLVSVSTSKTMGSPSGSFQFSIKAADNAPDPRQLIMDDDWVDIVFSRHDRQFHTVRGLIDRVARQTITSASGATSRTWLVTGREFGKVFEETEIFYNRYAGENALGGEMMLPKFAGLAGGGNVAETVQLFLFGLLQEQGSFGRQTWIMPDGIPGVRGGSTFVNEVTFDASGYSDDPKRIAVNANRLDPHGSRSWALAQQWADPQFCELFTDLRFGDGTIPGNEQELLPRDSRMTVVLRDRPFPTEAYRVFGPQAPGGTGIIESPWWNLPLYTINRQSIVTDDIGRSGAERRNAYLLSPQLYEERLGQMVHLSKVAWDVDDINRHGLRRMDITSSYTSIGDESDNVLTMSESQRTRIRDWFCLNPYFFSGSIALAHGRPDIRIGSRMRIPGREESEDETYYVEQVGHSWNLMSGVKTNMGVTRGWIGTDQSLRSALAIMIGRYREPNRALPRLLGSLPLIGGLLSGFFPSEG